MDFLGKMKGKVVDASLKMREGVEHVVAEASDKLHESRLRSQLKALLGGKQDRLSALGAKVFELHRGEGIGVDDLTAELADLDQLELQVVAKQEELDRFLSRALLPLSEEVDAT